jgi:pimeloyl-ACP methyl ester carboxylesterase
MVAARSEEVSMIVLLSGPAMPGEEVIYDQLELLSRAEGASEEEINQALEDQRAVFEALFAGGEVWEDHKLEFRQKIIEQLEALPETQKEALGDLDAYADVVFESQISQLESAWYGFFLTYDPAVDLEKVGVPVLAFYGGLDLQVPAEENKALLEEALARGGNTQVTTIVIPEANHLYQKAVTGSSSEYASLEFEFVPGFLEQLLSWVQEQTGTTE